MIIDFNTLLAWREQRLSTFSRPYPAKEWLQHLGPSMIGQATPEREKNLPIAAGRAFLRQAAQISAPIPKAGKAKSGTGGIAGGLLSAINKFSAILCIANSKPSHPDEPDTSAEPPDWLKKIYGYG